MTDARLVIDALFAALVYSLALWGGHYFRWPGNFMARYRIARYTYGLGWFLVCLSYVLVMHGLALWAGVAWCIAVAGGATNVVCYAWDGRQRDRRRLSVSEAALDADRADRF